jgi:hypothetical protein
MKKAVNYLWEEPVNMEKGPAKEENRPASGEESALWLVAATRPHE